MFDTAEAYAKGKSEEEMYEDAFIDSGAYFFLTAIVL